MAAEAAGAPDGGRGDGGGAARPADLPDEERRNGLEDDEALLPPAGEPDADTPHGPVGGGIGGIGTTGISDGEVDTDPEGGSDLGRRVPPADQRR